MFKQLKGTSTISTSNSTSSTSSSAGSTLSISDSTSSIGSTKNDSRPNSPVRGSTVLQVLQQQRRQQHKSSSSSNASLIQKLNESKKTTPTTSSAKNKKKSSSQKTTTTTTTTSTLPITARKKVKPIKAAGEGEVKEESAQEEQKPEKEQDALIPAEDEASVMAVTNEGDDELDAEGEDEIIEEATEATEASEAQSETEEEEISSAKQNVVVCVRVRPTSSSRSDSEEPAMWNFDGDRNRIVPTERHPTLAKRNTAASTTVDPAIAEDGSYDFSFDSLVLPSQSADEMYANRIAPIVNAVIKGYNGTVFAYGQTGSGKTYTMSGSESEKGVIPKAVHQIFDNVAKASSREFLLRVSYLEIYNESLNDLLAALPSTSAPGSSPDDEHGRPSSPIKGGSSHMVTNGNASSNGLRMFESAGRLQIQGLREEIVTEAEEVLNLLEKGQNARHQAATDWNERSSRSHCVFMLTVESRSKANKSSNVRFSQLNLIDLAGSERAASEKERRKEGAFINKSLLTLGTVIAKLSEQCASGTKEQHIPYRDSKLTRLLQSSLGGNARVAVVCTLSARKEHATESLSTLRFGSRCKMVTTRAKQGSVVDDKALIARYRNELEKLRAQLVDSNNNPIAKPEDDESIKALKQKREEAERDVKVMNDQRSELKKQIEHLTRLILTGKEVEQDQQQVHLVEDEDEIDRTKRIRAARRSDLGTSSPSKRRSVAQFPSSVLTPLRSSKFNQQENSLDTPLAKPFAMESELAQLRKSLSKALTAKQASEEARRKEIQLWQAKVAELEEANKEQEEELDEAEDAFKKLQSDRDILRAKVTEEQEANRLLKLVARSRTSDQTEEQKRILSERETEIKKLKGQLEKVEKVQQSLQNGAEEYMKQIKTLEEKLAESGSSSSTRVAELEKEIEALRAASANDDDGKSDHSETFKDASQGEVELLRERLRIAEEEKETLQNEIRQNALERGQEDAERDFAELIKPEKDDDDTTSALRKELQALKNQLKQQSKENTEQKTLIEELKANNGSKPLPVPSLSPSSSASPSMNDNLRTSMEKQLKASEERCKTLEKQIESMAARSIPSPPLSTSSASSSSGAAALAASRSPALVELQIESDIQRSRIASLERQLAEARARVQDSMSSTSSLGSLSLPGSPIKWSSSSRSNPGTPIKRAGTLDNVREEDDGDETVMLRAGPYSSASLGRRGSLLGRAGSMREYQRYSGSSRNIGGDLAMPSQTSDELERQLKEEREEIVRLNGVITTQRAIMADLEASVATWKKRLRTQQEIITKLVEAAGVKASPSLLAQTQSIGSPSTMETSGSNINHLKATLLHAVNPSGVNLKRTPSSVSTSSTSNPSPYYGAHLYNKPPVALGGAAQGLGLGSTSPTKGTSWLATMPGVRPDPLPLPDYAFSAGLSSPTGKSAHRRKTIEHEIESLKGSPRVEVTKYRLMDPGVVPKSSAQPPQTRSNRPLPTPGSPPKLRPSKDWYI